MKKFGPDLVCLPPLTIMSCFKTEHKSICESWATLTEPIKQAEIKSLLLDQILTFYMEFRVFAHTKRTMELFKKGKDFKNLKVYAIN